MTRPHHAHITIYTPHNILLHCCGKYFPDKHLSIQDCEQRFHSFSNRGPVAQDYGCPSSWSMCMLRFEMWDEMVHRQQWLLLWVFQSLVHHALLEVKDCWAAKFEGSLVVLLEVFSFETSKLLDVYNILIDDDWLVDIYALSMVQSQTSAYVKPCLCSRQGHTGAYVTGGAAFFFR